MSATRQEDWSQYGSKFLAALEEDRDWRSIEALWRFGGPSDMTPLAEVMAASGDDRLALVLTRELLTGRYASQVPTLPAIIYEHATAVGATVAAEVLDRLFSEEEPLAANYSDRPHLVMAWLLRQPSSALDGIAVEVAVGSHVYSDIGEPSSDWS